MTWNLHMNMFKCIYKTYYKAKVTWVVFYFGCKWYSPLNVLYLQFCDFTSVFNITSFIIQYKNPEFLKKIHEGHMKGYFYHCIEI